MIGMLLITLTLYGCGDSAPPGVSADKEVVFVYKRDMNQPTTTLNAPSKIEHVLTSEQSRQFIALINSKPSLNGQDASDMYVAIWHRNYFEVDGRKYALTSSSIFYRDEDKNTWSWSHPFLSTMTNLKDPDKIAESLEGMSKHDWPAK